MASPDHAPDQACEQEHPELVARNARVGLWLFAVYCVIYGGFVLLSAFAPGIIGAKPFGGINLAVIYGFALIGLALAMALVYLALCRRDRTGSGT